MKESIINTLYAIGAWVFFFGIIWVYSAYTDTGQVSDYDYDQYYEESRRDPQEEAYCDIKGNISYETGEKIYHLPSDDFYDDTEIDIFQGEDWFCTPGEAEAAGFRRAYR